MQTMLLVAELVIAAALILFVLLQRSEGGGLGMGGGGGGGSMGGLFSPRGAADTMTRTTAVLAALFFITCIALNLMALHGRDERSILDSPVTNAPVTKTVTPAPAGPSVPKPQ
jgi:preprotein translocase subunit SecG